VTAPELPKSPLAQRIILEVLEDCKAQPMLYDLPTEEVIGLVVHRLIDEGVIRFTDEDNS